MPFVEEKDGDTVLRVRVQPRASRNELRAEADGRIRVALTAPPADGAANEALVAFIAKSLGIAKSRVTLIHGERGREKSLRIEGLDAGAVAAALLRGARHKAEGRVDR